MLNFMLTTAIYVLVSKLFAPFPNSWTDYNLFTILCYFGSTGVPSAIWTSELTEDSFYTHKRQQAIAL